MPYKDPAKKKASDAAYHIAHRAQKNVCSSAHYAAHREEYKARVAAWAALHPEEVKAFKATYAATHHEEKRASGASWRAAHPGERDAAIAAWGAANPDKRAVTSQRYRARKASAPRNDLTDEEWGIIKNAFHHCCAYCGKKGVRLHQEHITPVSKSGSYTLHNIVPACKSCNSKKNTGPPLCPVQPVML